ATSAGSRSLGVSNRPGGDHQRAQARARSPRRDSCPLQPRRSRAGDPRRRGRKERRVVDERSRHHRHARAGRALRRRLERRPTTGRRIRRGGAAARQPRGLMATRVLIVDDQALVRAGFRMILAAQPDIAVVGEVENGLAAIEAARGLRPDVVLMDIRMPGLDGIAATRRLTTMGLDAHVVILTTYDLDEYVFDALAAGATGFLLKHVPPEELVHGVRIAAGGESLLAPSVTRRLIEEFARQRSPVQASSKAIDSLTDREREVLKLLARGLSNLEIASELHVGEATVKTHVAHVLDKLELRDRVQAVILAYEVGLIKPGA